MKRILWFQESRTPRPAVRLLRLLVAVILCVGIGVGVSGRLAQAQGQGAGRLPPVTFPQSRLVVETDDGRRIPFIVDIATTSKQRVRGLMYRDSLAADAGMLFVWEQPAFQTMWMKNTLIPLDMLFIDQHGVIVQVVANTTPRSLEQIASPEPVLGVLEINAGTARLMAIEPGDRVLHPFLGTATTTGPGSLPPRRDPAEGGQ